jgi:3-isopropylmalate/(R)-2-methylmalate dehydratase large subunit
MTVVCGDSHTATHGAFGALAFGIGTSEVEHVLATQCLLQRKSKTFAVRWMARCGPASGQGHHPGADRQDRHRRRHRLRLRIHRQRHPRAVMEERMTVCNMSIEGGARAGLIAPDDTTFEYLAAGRTRPRAPMGRGAWRAGSNCRPTRARPTTAELTIDADALEPMITYGTNPGMGIADHGRCPTRRRGRPDGARFLAKALATWASKAASRCWPPHRRGLHRQLHQLADLRSARRGVGAEGPQGEPEGARAGGAGLAGSQAPGHRRRAAGDLPRRRREWREPGCSMCIAMNGDQLSPASTASRPATAISKAGRARADARSWPAR